MFLLCFRASFCFLLCEPLSSLDHGRSFPPFYLSLFFAIWLISPAGQDRADRGEPALLRDDVALLIFIGVGVRGFRSRETVGFRLRKFMVGRNIKCAHAVEIKK